VHTIERLVAQRIDDQALGYEDLSDHDELHYHPVLPALLQPASLHLGVDWVQESIVGSRFVVSDDDVRGSARQSSSRRS
jgi:hypothetical protein